MVYFLKQTELDLAYEYVNAHCGESLNVREPSGERDFDVAYSLLTRSYYTGVYHSFH